MYMVTMHVYYLRGMTIYPRNWLVMHTCASFSLFIIIAIAYQEYNLYHTKLSAVTTRSKHIELITVSTAYSIA